MENQWSKSETSNGIPYYINHYSEVTQWDHPDLVSAMSSLSKMDNIQFGAYRTAAKLRMLQKVLHMDVVNLITVRMAFELHGYSRHNDSVMDAVQLYNIINEMYHMTKVRGRSTLRVNRCSDLLLNWLLNLFDVQRTGCIRVLPVKLGIAIICSARITDKYRYFQDLLANRIGSITRKMMSEFMHDVTQITNLIGESGTFGKGVGASVEDCFQSALGPTISQDDFYQWLMSEPQTLVWLPTLHRFSTAETMKHEVKCSVCKMYPIIGLRYQCLKCFNFDLCQNCFFTRRSSKHHKQSHPMQEYCLSSKSKEDVRAFTKTVRNNLSKKHGRRIKKKYRSIENGWESDDKASDNQDAELETHVRLSQMSERLKAVEAQQPPGLHRSTSLPPSIKSARPSIGTTTTDESRYQERRELENLIDELERENDELMDDLERLGLHVQDSTSSSSTETDSEPREREPSPHDRTRLVEQRNEVFARYEVLEEHNKKLEEQLKNFRTMIHRKETSQGRSDHSPRSASLNHSPSYPPSNTNFHHQGSMNHTSNHSSGYQASSGYDRKGERLPPYGQSHPALDTIADHSSGSSGASAVRPRFVMMGKDYPDGHGDPGLGPQPLYTSQALPVGVGQHVNGQGNVSRAFHQHRMTDLSKVATGSFRLLPPAPPYPGNMDSSVLAPPVVTHARQTSAPAPLQGSGDGAHSFYGLQSDASPVHQASVGGVYPFGSQSAIAPHHDNSQGYQTSLSHSADIPFSSQHPSRLEQSHHVGFQIDQSHPSGLQTDQSHASRFQMDQSHASRFQTDQSHLSGFQTDQSHPSRFKNNQSIPAAFQMNKSRALESVLDLERFLPNINDQSTVHFPTTGVSMAYPSEEAELDELIQRMTDAFPLHDSPSPPPPAEPHVPVMTMEEFLLPRPRRSRGSRRGSGDLFSAANRIGEAMSTLVTRVSVEGAQG
nr:dystrophin-like isoform X1 [Lytechinus pictus]